MTKYGRIYIIRNTVNEKVYVGQTTVSIKLRFQNHLSATRNGKGYVIGKAIRKYGEQNFYIELLEECLEEELNEREIYWISFFNSTDTKFGYNMSIGGNVTRATGDLNELEILKEFKSGVPVYMLAKQHHTSPYNISVILKKNNIKYGLDLQKTSKEEELKIVDLYLIGYSTVDISKKTSKNKSTIRRILIRNGISLRTFKETKNLGRNLPTLV